MSSKQAPYFRQPDSGTTAQRAEAILSMHTRHLAPFAAAQAGSIQQRSHLSPAPAIRTRTAFSTAKHIRTPRSGMIPTSPRR